MVHHDIAEALDKKCMTALVLLDISAAFDVSDHRILQICLEYSHRVAISALSWVKSCLIGSLQHVAMENSTEDKCLDFDDGEAGKCNIQSLLLSHS